MTDWLNKIETHRKAPVTLEAVIRHIEATNEDQWQTDVVRSKDGKRNCFFGHLFNMGRDEKHANEIWDWFEAAWATTYVIYRINDGENPRYQQPTPKQRVLAFLHALQAGTEPCTRARMAESSELSTYRHLQRAEAERDALAAKLTSAQDRLKETETNLQGWMHEANALKTKLACVEALADELAKPLPDGMPDREGTYFANLIRTALKGNNQ